MMREQAGENVALEADILRIREASEAWAHRVQASSSVAIAPRSLFGRDAPLPGDDSVARLAWRSLGTAGEHVALAHQVLLLTDNGVAVKPFLTLSRTATIGAARAIYLLQSCDVNERAIRALRVLRTEANDGHRLALNSEGFESTDPKAAIQGADIARSQIEAELVRRGQKPGSVVADGKLIESAAETLDDPEHAKAALVHLWHISSGNAHCRSWPWGMPYYEDSTMMQFAMIWSMPITLMEKAWDLWNLSRRNS